MPATDPPQDPLPEAEPWEFAGWGTAGHISDLDTSQVTVSRLDSAHKHSLGVWPSTAICGNDITSSTLYVSALCAAQAGRYAPIVLVVVAAVLYLFRRIYAEVGSALPLNGGTYTVLLNTTNKRLAAAAACLTLLSYVATAVISAGEAMHYAHNLWAGLPVFGATIGLLGLFAVLNVVGITESSVVALGIFVFHITTLTVLTVVGGHAVIADPSLLIENWSAPSAVSLPRALFFGFAAAMLGISGFESSANFIEEQRKGVFPKTLRNMWVAVAIFNPLMSLLSLGLLPLAEIQSVPPDLLARMGEVSWGGLLRSWVSLDAVLVLSGAVLTSYVGVTGLMRRMSLDRCLPAVFLQENRLRKTNHWIILAFFGVCASIMFATGGEVETLAGVYTISFLSVMSLFAVGNMLLKVKRGRLPRETRASWSSVSVALVAVLVGLVGNVLLDPAYVRVFGVYFVATGAVVAAMFLRVQLLRVVLFIVRGLVDRVERVSEQLSSFVRRYIEDINSRAVVYFTKGDDPAELNRAALYVLENEQTTYLKVVHCTEQDHSALDAQLAERLKEIDHLYPELRIDFLSVKGTFGPELIELLSERLGVPKNYMFIGTPGDRFPHRIEDLGGVRLIL
ncbi:MAG: APC family permease [Alphaproteobacteria bacterium]|nr:APC family permease [Alphaproteobacteria bacterium]